MMMYITCEKMTDFYHTNELNLRALLFMKLDVDSSSTKIMASQA